MGGKQKTEITPERVMDALAQIAFEETEVKTSERMKALELLGKPLGLWKDASAEDGLEGELSKLSELLEQRRERREDP